MQLNEWWGAEGGGLLQISARVKSVWLLYLEWMFAVLYEGIAVAADKKR